MENGNKTILFFRLQGGYMDIKQAIRRIEDHTEIHFKKEYPRAMKITEALEMAVAALRKQDGIKHHHTMIRPVEGEMRISICPSCLWMNYTSKDDYPKFCNSCGQAIKWDDTGDKL